MPTPSAMRKKSEHREARRKASGEIGLLHRFERSALTPSDATQGRLRIWIDPNEICPPWMSDPDCDGPGLGDWVEE
jgi:hypothetical protein